MSLPSKISGTLFFGTTPVSIPKDFAAIGLSLVTITVLIPSRLPSESKTCESLIISSLIPISPTKFKSETCLKLLALPIQLKRFSLFSIFFEHTAKTESPFFAIASTDSFITPSSKGIAFSYLFKTCIFFTPERSASAYPTINAHLSPSGVSLKDIENLLSPPNGMLPRFLNFFSSFFTSSPAEIAAFANAVSILFPFEAV